MRQGTQFQPAFGRLPTSHGSDVWRNWELRKHVAASWSCMYQPEGGRIRDFSGHGLHFESSNQINYSRSWTPGLDKVWLADYGTTYYPNLTIPGNTAHNVGGGWLGSGPGASNYDLTIITVFMTPWTTGAWSASCPIFSYNDTGLASGYFLGLGTTNNLRFSINGSAAVCNVACPAGDAGTWEPVIAIGRFSRTALTLDTYSAATRSRLQSATPVALSNASLSYTPGSGTQAHLLGFSSNFRGLFGATIVLRQDIGPVFAEYIGTGGLGLGSIFYELFAHDQAPGWVLPPQGAVTNKSLESDLTLTESSATKCFRSRSISDTETISGASVGYAIRRRPAKPSVLSLSDEVAYVGPHRASATSVLSLTDTSHLCVPFTASAVSHLSISSSASEDGPIYVSATNALSLEDMVERGIFLRSLESDLNVSQSASSTLCHFSTGSNQLTLGSNASKSQISVFAASAVALVHSTRQGSLTLSSASVLQLSEHVATNIHMIASQSAISTVDSASLRSPLRVVVESSLQIVVDEYDPHTGAVVELLTGLHDTATASHLAYAPHTSKQFLQIVDQTVSVHLKSGAIVLSAASCLELGGSLGINQVGLSISSVTITDGAQVDKCTPVITGVDLTDGVAVVMNRGRNTLSRLGVQQSVAFFIGGRDYTAQYVPFIGEGDGGTLVPSSTIVSPLTGITAPFQMICPDDGQSVTLRAPNLGNKDRLAFNRVLRETRGGTLVVFADPMWPKIQTQALTFSALRRSEAQALLTFLDNHLGLEVVIIDWEQRGWRGVITTPDAPVTEDSFNSYSASFQFEGELDESLTPPQVPVQPGTPLRRVSTHNYTSVNPVEPTPVYTLPEEAFSSQADSDQLIGQPVYVTSAGSTALAKADQSSTSGVVGFTVTSALSGSTSNYVTGGKLILLDWSSVAGSVSLVPGSVYYLDANVAGHITNILPGNGNYLVRVGRAVSTTTLDIEIEPSVLL